MPSDMDRMRLQRSRVCWKSYLAWEAEDREETLAALHEGFADMEAGRKQPVEEMFEELRQQYGFPRWDQRGSLSASR
jgi:predicted transcriptional regulator